MATPSRSASYFTPLAKPRRQILVVYGDLGMLEFIANLLEPQFDVTLSSSVSEAIEKLHAGLDPEIILFDVFAGNGEELRALADLRSVKTSASIIALSCIDNPQHIISVYRMGVKDIVVKPFKAHEIQNSVERVFASSGTGSHEIALNENLSFVHSSKRMQEVRAQCSLVARVDLPVLILGESGTGKEVIAEYIHSMSPRRNRTFLKVNCAAMPADLLESELFGYEQGAFTGAVRAKAGKFEICNNGTILLDEIGEMPPALQAKLLHVLQDGNFSRLGSRVSQRVDVRVIAATNIDIKSAIAQRRFREDLYYRLNGFCVQLPPLRDRKDEIPILIDYFTRKVADKYGSHVTEVSPLLLKACMAHDWPGNLRELENFVKRMVVLNDESMMLDELRPRRSGVAAITSPAHSANGLKRVARDARDEAEAVAIANALEETNWNRKKAASELQISYKALLYKIKQYSIQAPAAV